MGVSSSSSSSPHRQVGSHSCHLTQGWWGAAFYNVRFPEDSLSLVTRMEAAEGQLCPDPFLCPSRHRSSHGSEVSGRSLKPLCCPNPSGGAWGVGAGGDAHSGPALRGRSCRWAVREGLRSAGAPPGTGVRRGALPGSSHEAWLQKKIVSCCSPLFLQQLWLYLHTLFADLLNLGGEKSLYSSP